MFDAVKPENEVAGCQTDSDKEKLCSKDCEVAVKFPGPRSDSSCTMAVPARYTLCLLAFMGFAVVYSLRVNLSVALVAMVNSTYANSNSEANSPECRVGNSTGKSSEKDDGEFKWDQDTQGIVLGAFFFGYIFTQLPGGWLAGRYGGTRLFGYGVLCTSILTLITPVTVRWSLNMFIVLRILEGLGEGVTYPSMHAIWSHWAPPLERSKLTTFSYAGAQFGTIISMPISGYLCEHGFDGGWPSVFYIFGGVGIFWFVFWMMLAYDCPAFHPHITQAEREYIEKGIGSGNDRKTQTVVVPWSSIWTSPAVWAITIVHFCNNWGFYTLLTCLPSYFKEVLDFRPQENGLYSALPYILQCLITMVAGFVADTVRHKGLCSTVMVRKILTTLALCMSSGFIVAAGFVGCDKVLGIALLTLGNGCIGMGAAGFNVNHLDISPRYAGVLLGITNSAGTIPGIIGPYVAGSLTNNQPTRQQWQKVFFISAGISVFGALVYLIFGSGKEQSWNTPEEEYLEPVIIPRHPRTPISVQHEGHVTSPRGQAEQRPPRD